jgi:dihydrofolate reductase
MKIMKTAKVSIIVSMDEKQGIGKDDDLLFKVPDDLARFVKLTTGHSIIMGRKTYESKPLRRVLSNRTNIIITRDRSYQVAGAEIVYSLQEALLIAQIRPGSEEVFIIGGGQIFKEAMEANLVDRLYLTIVKGEFGADTFFPEYSNFTKVIEKEERDANSYQYTFLTLEK